VAAPRWDGMSTNELFAELRRTGNPKLRAYLVERHLGLVRHVVHLYLNSGESYEDLLSVGYLGLVQAVDRYDPSRGTRFATFAVPTIRGEIRRYFRDRTWSLRVPRRLQELSLRARNLLEELTQGLGRSPTYAELAQQLKVAEEEIIEALEVGRQHDLVSLDTSNEEEETNDNPSLGERIGETDLEIEQLFKKAEITHALRQLPARLKLVIILRFYLEMSQEEVGVRLGVSQMHISRLQQQALNQLRQILKKQQ